MKLKQLTEKIIEAVPEIMELKIGCEILLKDENKIKATGSCSTASMLCVDKLGWRYYAFLREGKIQYITPNQSNGSKITDFKILGRQIILEDVLRAIFGTKSWENWPDNITRKEGHCLTEKEAQVLNLIVSVWVFGKSLSENWEKWSDKEKDFLHGILVK